MSLKLSRDELLAAAPAGLGTVYVNHDGCSAGTDTKHRLCVTRDEKGVVGHCFHCGASGATRTTSRGQTRNTADEVVSRIPPDTVLPWTEWSPAARGWLTKYNLTEADTAPRGIGFVPKNGRVYVPVTFDGELYGWQMRAVEPGQEPKYLGSNYAGRRMKDVGYWQRGYAPDADQVCIVEDMLSAIKLSPYVDAVALLGTTITPGILDRIQQDYTSAFIWMDPDTAGIKAARELSKEVGLFVPTTCVASDRQPKEASPSQLREVFGH
jgi:hypothetical protein